MKIGIFANSYLPIVYGSITSVENFRIGLEKQGHEVYLFVPNYKGYKYKNPRVTLYPTFMYGYKIKYPIPFTLYPPIRKKAKDLGLDIVHVQQPFSTGQDGLRVARKLNIPVIFTHHARYADYTHYIPSIIPQKLIKKIIARNVSRFANKCDRIIAPSESIVEYIRDNNIKTKVSVLSTGIDWEKFQVRDCSEIRKKHSISDKSKVVLYLGRIEEEKDVMFLADAVFSLMKADKSIVFVFVGEGSSVPKIRSYAEKLNIQERVIFVGAIEQSEVQKYYAEADLFVHASRTETQGMTITEAMSAGLPIVAVRGTGVSDQIENGKTGMLTPFDRKDFTRNVKELLGDDVRSFELGEAARKKAKEMDYLSKAIELEAIYIEEIEKKKKLLCGKSL